jgi:ABC-2 type transport system permease protein
MNKYLQIFKISFEEEFAYRLNFILWRFRNVLQIFLTYFLWSTVYSDPTKEIFGYDRTKILTYVFGIMIVRALVLSARAMDVSNDVASGDLSNYLIKPIGYFRYWFTRDIASKVLNLSFATVEFALLFILLKPPFFFQANAGILFVFLISIILAIFIYSLILFLLSSIPFWVPEIGWGSHFLVSVVIVEALSGALFPINILPQVLQSIVLATPFPYLIYFPVEVYLGNVSGWALFGGLITAAAWVGVLWILLNVVWQRGLKAYQSFGR